jgi:hypothetical protein
MKIIFKLALIIFPSFAFSCEKPDTATEEISIETPDRRERHTEIQFRLIMQSFSHRIKFSGLILL